MFNDDAVRADLRVKLALVNGKPLDYLSLHTGPKYAEFARVDVGARDPSEVTEEVLVHMYDCAQEAQDRGETWCKVRAKFWRKNAPAGSKVWATEGSPTDPTDPPLRSLDDARMARDSEMVGAMQQLRLGNERLLSAVESGQAAGWRLAQDMMRSNMQLQARIAELQLQMAQLQQQQAAPQENPATAMLQGMLPQVLMHLLTTRAEPSPPDPAPAPPPPPTPPPSIPAE